MYDESCHVRVRILSSHSFPVDFDKCEITKVEEDKGSGLFKVSTYTKGIEFVKVGVADMWEYGRTKARTLTSVPDS